MLGRHDSVRTLGKANVLNSLNAETRRSVGYFVSRMLFSIWNDFGFYIRAHLRYKDPPSKLFSGGVLYFVKPLQRARQQFFPSCYHCVLRLLIPNIHNVAVLIFVNSVDHTEILSHQWQETFVSSIRYFFSCILWDV